MSSPPSGRQPGAKEWASIASGIVEWFYVDDLVRSHLDLCLELSTPTEAKSATFRLTSAGRRVVEVSQGEEFKLTWRSLGDATDVASGHYSLTSMMRSGRVALTVSQRRLALRLLLLKGPLAHEAQWLQLNRYLADQIVHYLPDRQVDEALLAVLLHRYAADQAGALFLRDAGTVFGPFSMSFGVRDRARVLACVIDVEAGRTSVSECLVGQGNPAADCNVTWSCWGDFLQYYLRRVGFRDLVVSQRCLLGGDLPLAAKVYGLVSHYDI